MFHINSKDFFNLEGYPHHALWNEGDPVWKALDRLNSYIKTLITGPSKGFIHPTAILINPESIFIDEGSEVGAYVQIEGPCYIGKGCLIRHGALIRSGTLISDGVIVGHASEIKSSLLLPRAKAPHFNYVGDSILGCDVNLGAGVICANFRLDAGEIVIKGKNPMPTGRNKLGAIIGDGSSISCNSVLNPGTLIPPGYRGGAPALFVRTKSFN